MDKIPTQSGVFEAAKSIAAILTPTPLLPVEIDGVEVHVKAENLQPVGAFKIRGGWWRLSNLNEAERAQGCLLYTSPSPRDRQKSRMPSSA